MNVELLPLASSGVTLTTEDPRNLGLYSKFGYQLLGNSRVDQELESWSFYRPSRVRESR